ncbi:MAG TPA: class I SAM-dependent methyltransferase [Galbitalea sp.]|jgi:SAM-dependent methyltransferase|nr:class I SAM-dependent methyltransferase [Galbitalea sp.]
MSTDDVRGTYDTVAKSYADRIQGLSAESPLEIALIDRFAIDAIKRGGRVLDAGCGPGRVADYLAHRGIDVRGVDLSPAMVEVARAAYPALHFEVGSIEALPCPDGELAGVIAWYSTIHTPVEQLPEIYDEFARVLSPGGLLLLGFHAGIGVHRISRSYGHDVDIEVQLFDGNELEGLLAEAGFTIEATLARAAVGGEKRPQGFILASKAQRARAVALP